eukprot:5389449-Ditylum_brightwellii.AAC.1
MEKSEKGCEKIVLLQKLAEATQKHERLLDESDIQNKEIALMKQSLEILQSANDNSSVEDPQGADDRESGQASDRLVTNTQI